MILNLSNKKRGFTLLEMLVATSVFVIVFILAGELIINIIQMQARARAIRTVQEEARYVLEEITREGRLAQGSDLPFSTNAEGTSVTFQIKKDESKTIILSENRLKIIRMVGGTSQEVIDLTSNKVKVSSIQVTDSEGNKKNLRIFDLERTGNIQYLTIKFKIEINPDEFPPYAQNIAAEFQTSITSRKYGSSL